MTLELVLSIIIAAAPALTAIIGIVAAVCKLINSNKCTNAELSEKFEEVRAEVISTKQYEELKAQLTEAHQENRELKKLIKELINKIDKIERTE